MFRTVFVHHHKGIVKVMPEWLTCFLFIQSNRASTLWVWTYGENVANELLSEKLIDSPHVAIH